MSIFRAAVMPIEKKDQSKPFLECAGTCRGARYDCDFFIMEVYVCAKKMPQAAPLLPLHAKAVTVGGDFQAEIEVMVNYAQTTPATVLQTLIDRFSQSFVDANVSECQRQKEAGIHVNN